MQVTDKLDWTISSIGFIAPELIITTGILVLIIVGLFPLDKVWAKVTSLVILTSSVISLLLNQGSETAVSLFGSMLAVDGFNFYLRCLIGVAGIAIIIVSDRGSIAKNPFEYFTLVLSIILGAQLLVMSQHFVMLILSLELMSIPAYVLAGFTFDKAGAEATMKYFIYGSVATAFLIFGTSWIYGLSDTLNFSSASFPEKLKFNDHELFLGAGLLVIGGLLFKMASTPFHFWAPDIYQSSSFPVLVLFSTIPKVAAGAVIIKIVNAFGLAGGSRYDWQSIAASIAILTLTVGNFSALIQKNVKRLMAYSSIGQAGFLLIGSATLSNSGSQFYLFYSTVLIISTALAFLALRYFESVCRTQSIKDFSGLGRQLPGMSSLLTIAMISLVGLPVTAGFTAKLFIFTGLLGSWSATGKTVLVWLFAFGLLNTVVSLYYYLKVPYYLFLKRGAQRQITAEKPLLPILFGVFLAFTLLWLFFQPDSLMGWINRITFATR